MSTTLDKVGARCAYMRRCGVWCARACVGARLGAGAEGRDAMRAADEEGEWGQYGLGMVDPVPVAPATAAVWAAWRQGWCACPSRARDVGVCARAREGGAQHTRLSE